MIVISIMAAPAAAPWTAAPAACNGGVGPNLHPAPMVHVRVDDPNTKTPMGPSAGAPLQSLESNPTFTEMGNGGAPYGYSRLTIRFTPCRDAYQRTLIPEQRNAIYRYFFGKQAD